MSLLEDVFLQDEAGEAQELERVIEGDEYDERPVNSDDNSEKEDEAVEDKRRVDPSAKPQRVVKNPRFILNPARLTGPRGIQVIPEHFKDFKFKGRGHEKDDLDIVLKKLEHWAYRLYPKFQFHDCLKKIETLGKKRPVMVHLQKIRSDQFLSEETVVQQDSSDDETPQVPEEDEFDKLLQQQIELARATPAPGSVKKGVGTPAVDRSFTMPKATSSPSISDDQKERMLRNRKLAEERRLARLKQNTSTVIVEDNHENRPINDETRNNKENSVFDDEGNGIENLSNFDGKNKTVNNSNKTDNHENNTVDHEDDIVFENNKTNEIHKKKHNRSNVIDSDSEEDCEVTTVNQSISVDVHESRNKDLDEIDVFDSLKENIEEKKTELEVEPKDNESKVIEESNNDRIEISNDLTAIDIEVRENKDTELNKDKVTENSIEMTTSVDNVCVNEVMDSIQEEETEIQDASQNNKGVSEAIQNEEGLMDVDFSDDF